MPLTPTWALLGVSCVCLLFGNANVNAEKDKMEPGQEVQDGEPPSLTEKPPETAQVVSKTPKFPTKKTTKSYSFPIVSKGGVLYYDLAGVEDTKLDILSNDQSVKGITASHGECKVRSLYLGTSYMLDEDLLTNCPQLNLRLAGKKWRCVQEGRMLQQRGVVVDMSEAECKEVWHDNSTIVNQKNKIHKYGMEEGTQKLMEFGITSCSAERCECRWYFKEDSYSVNVNCEGVGLTDDTLPTLPDKIKDIRMERNALRSMDKLVKHLLPHNQTLEVVRVDDNFMEELPRFPNGTFPRIVDISLTRNKIEKIDVEVFKELITRKDLIISLEGNTFPCDCVLYRFKVCLEENYLRHWKAFISLMHMECKYKGENKTAKIHTVSEDLCKTWLDTWLDGWQTDRWWSVLNLTLGGLNLFVIYLMVDLICILKHVRWKKESVPLMDRIVCRLFWVRHQQDLPRTEGNEDWEMEVNRRGLTTSARRTVGGTETSVRGSLSLY